VLFIPLISVFATVLAFVLGLVAHTILDNLEEEGRIINVFVPAVIGTAIAFIVIVAFVFIACAKFFHKERNSEILSTIERQPEVCRNIQDELQNIQNAATHLQTVITDSAIKAGIIPRGELDVIESSVSKGCGIYILTSKFVLEGEQAFRKIISNNFRKGVKYTYYVPKNSKLYNTRVSEWYQDFSCFLNSYSNATKLLDVSKAADNEWSSDYVALIKKAIVIRGTPSEFSTTKAGAKGKHKEKSGQTQRHTKLNSQQTKELEDLTIETKKLFNSLLETYELEDCMFYITVAMYEIKLAEWKAIIKLPTETPLSAEYFTSFSVSGSKTLEDENKFIDRIKKLCDGKNVTYYIK
jgi:hypothetical protein